MYFSVVLYRVERGEADIEENVLSVASLRLRVPVGKSNEKGTVTKISEPMSAKGNVKSRVVDKPERCF